VSQSDLDGHTKLKIAVKSNIQTTLTAPGQCKKEDDPDQSLGRPNNAQAF